MLWYGVVFIDGIPWINLSMKVFFGTKFEEECRKARPDKIFLLPTEQ